MSLRLCSEAPSTRIFWLVGFRRAGGTGIASSSRRYLRGQRSRLQHQVAERAREHDAPALLTRAEPHVDHYVSDLDHVRIVLDDEDGVPLVPQLPQDRDQAIVVARMQADGRFVEDVQGIDQRRPQRGRQIDSLRLAARKRRRQAIEGQIVEADVSQEPQSLPDLLQHLVGGTELAGRTISQRTSERASL